MIEQFIAAELSEAFDGKDLFAAVCALEGETYRELESRRTIRTRILDDWYFAKIHFGSGWGEIFKNLLQARLPVLGAGNEWRALNRLAEVGVPSMVPVLYYRERHWLNPASECSAILTRSLEDKVSLEDFVPASPVIRRRLIQKVASMARDMHRGGVNHRDFYLCHFLMDRGSDADPVLHLIDLHRAQVRDRVPDRWLIKDLGGLLFSAFDKALTRRDLLRFLRHYRDASLREMSPNEKNFWRAVRRRAIRLYLQDHQDLPPELSRLLTWP